MPRKKISPRDSIGEWDTPPSSPVVGHPLEEEDAYVASPITVPKPRKPKSRDDLADLRSRAKRAAAESRSGITISVKVSKDLYKALVELAEQYHRPISDIARQALSDGTRKYHDFSLPSSPFAPPPSRVYAPPALRHNSEWSLVDAMQARREAAPEPDEEEMTTSVAEALANIDPGALFPQGFKRKAPVEDTGIFPEESDETQNQ